MPRLRPTPKNDGLLERPPIHSPSQVHRKSALLKNRPACAREQATPQQIHRRGSGETPPEHKFWRVGKHRWLFDLTKFPRLSHPHATRPPPRPHPGVGPITDGGTAARPS